MLQQVRLAGSLLHCIRTKLVYFEFASFREKMHYLWLFRWKRLVLQSILLERINQNAQIYLKTTLLYNRIVYFVGTSLRLQNKLERASS